MKPTDRHQTLQDPERCEHCGKDYERSLRGRHQLIECRATGLENRAKERMRELSLQMRERFAPQVVLGEFIEIVPPPGAITLTVHRERVWLTPDEVRKIFP